MAFDQRLRGQKAEAWMNCQISVAAVMAAPWLLHGRCSAALAAVEEFPTALAVHRLQADCCQATVLPMPLVAAKADNEWSGPHFPYGAQNAGCILICI